MHLDVESLRVLLAVLDHGGMTRAAEQLHLSQSAVSRKVQRLESRVGRPLLIRDGHQLRPTRDGRDLLPNARALVALHDQAVARLERSELTGTVRVSSNGEVNVAQIASLLGTFKLRHPAAHVEYTLDYSGQTAQAVDEGTIDLAILETPKDEIRPTDTVLWLVELAWVTSAGCSFQHAPVPTIDFGDCCYYNEFAHRILADAGIDFVPVFSAGSSHDVRAAVQAGIGVSVMSRRYLGGDVVEWEPPVALAPLPTLAQVLRIVPGEQSGAVTALAETIAAELRNPLDNSATLAG